jgi:D-beta-D-heptose 7-phosphate kinase/D-beta-D-heptose 1-phosphate adenosyltransferase
MKILIIGDVMIDIYYNSIVRRKSPEANEIPIYDIIDKNYILGGASNVAVNLFNLEKNIELISIAGNDEYGDKIKKILDEKHIPNCLFIDQNRKTTQKNRIIKNNKIEVRYDIEDVNDISNELEEKIIKYITNQENIDAIIISDYDKGMITEYLAQQLIQFANNHNIYTFVDPKIKNYFKYRHCFLFKPNLNEAMNITNNKYSTNIELIINELKNKIQFENILLTCGKDGMYLNNIDNHVTHNNYIIPLDVTGAGDNVLCIVTYIFLKEKDLLLATKIANYIAGKSVQHFGNYQFFNNDISEYYLLNENKIIYENELEKMNRLSEIKNIVFTNGCFDIIHSAHIKLLQFSKKQGKLLVVGLNSDSSIKKLKGDKRPINSISERCELILSLNIVDFIVIFDNDSPYNILKKIKPEKIIKGGDYTKKTVIGSEFCNEVILFNYIEGKSTSLIVDKILEKL